MRRVLLVLCLLLIVVHQDFWNWSAIDPRLFGFLPTGVWYHAGFAIACSVLMALLVQFVWPRHLESAEPETPEARIAEGGEGH